MPEIHPTAILDGDTTLAEDVRIGPHCVINGPVTIGEGTRLIGSVYVNGPATIGRRNVIYPNCCLGFAPQSVSYDPAKPGCGLVIGDGNTFREAFTANRAMTDAGPTRIGDENFFMANTHVGHDTQVGNRCTIANGAVIAGHARLDDGVNMGGISGVHQFVHVGRGVMISGLAAPTVDVPPFFMVTAVNVCGSVNLVGMRRSGIPRDQIDDVRWVYRTLYREGLSPAGALERLRERQDRPMVAEFIEFIESSTRGICRGRAKVARGAVSA